jgi:hypothetical protein
MPVIEPQLERIAREVVWWEPPETTIADQDNFLNWVMVRGFWEDMQYTLKIYGVDAFRNALRRAKPGVFDPASWHYWHHRLGFESVPELPERKFE